MVRLLPLLLATATSAASVAGPAPHAPATVRAGGPGVVEYTALDARRGDRLVLRNLAGRLVVEGVAGDRVTLSGDRRDQGVGLVRDGSRLVLGDDVRSRRGGRRSLLLRVPRWLPVEVEGTDLEVSVSGLRADLSVRTAEGDMEVRDVEGTLDLHAMDGEVSVDGVAGRLRAVSMDEDVRVRRARGSVRVESTDGDLTLQDVDADEVDATTVDGDVSFRGRVRPGGTVRLVTHNGDVTAVVPPGTGAQVSVSTFDGAFHAGFPVRVERYRGGREASFTIGEGGARLVLQAFDGDIRLMYGDDIR